MTRMHGEIPNNKEIINKISNCVEVVRQEETGQGSYSHSLKDGIMINSEISVPELDAAKEKTQNTVIEAEKFRAAIAQPSGKHPNVNATYLLGDQEFTQEAVVKTGLENLDLNKADQVLHLPVEGDKVQALHQVLESMSPNTSVDPPKHVGLGLSDDDFFHLTCHIDQVLQQKIEKGQYVDLDKLLPRDRMSPFDGRVNSVGDESKFEWVQQDGGTFLMPAKRTSCITSFRKWEQAFRVYTTIYCSENPNRSREIWQYISVINTAISSFMWDNVYSYDIIFRQLMEFNPVHSWAVTYNQMWNLSMRDPLPNRGQRSNFGSGLSGSGTGFQQQGSFGNGRGNKRTLYAGKRTKSDYCWNFNKGVKCKWGKNCRFIECCSYCDSNAHGVHACPKLDKKDKDKDLREDHVKKSVDKSH